MIWCIHRTPRYQLTVFGSYGGHGIRNSSPTAMVRNSGYATGLPIGFSTPGTDTLLGRDQYGDLHFGQFWGNSTYGCQE